MEEREPLVPEQQAPEAQERSADTMFQGRVLLEQHTEGYRFSVDAVLLAYTVAQMKPGTALEIGPGCGVISLLLADLWQREHQQTPPMRAVEVQPSLATLARENIAQNQRSQQIELVEADARGWCQAHPRAFRLVFANPPFYPVASGQSSPNQERAAARHEHNGTLEQLLVAMSQAVHARGTVALIYPVDGVPRLLRGLQKAQLFPTYMQWVHAHQQATAKLVLVRAKLRQSPLEVAPPLFLYKQPQGRVYTNTLEAMLNGDTPV